MPARIDGLRLERGFDDPNDGRVDVYPIYEDGTTTLLPGWSFHPVWVGLRKNSKLTVRQESMLLDEAIYRGQVLGKEFTERYLAEVGYVG